MSRLCIFCCLGRPVDKLSDIDYVPTVFAYKTSAKSAKAKQQSEERSKRLDKKRQAVKAKDKEQADQEIAAEGLLLLKSTEVKHDVANQTETTAMVSIGMQTERSHVSVSAKPSHRVIYRLRL